MHRRVNHRHGVCAHFAGADGVVDRLRDVSRRVQQFGIRLIVRARSEFLDDERRHGRGANQLSCDAHGIDGRVLIIKRR